MYQDINLDAWLTRTEYSAFTKVPMVDEIQSVEVFSTLPRETSTFEVLVIKEHV